MVYHVVLTVSWTQPGQHVPEMEMLSAIVDPKERTTSELFNELYISLCSELRSSGTLPREIDPVVVCFAVHPQEL
jgi:hypothetical protein